MKDHLQKSKPEDEPVLVFGDTRACGIAVCLGRAGHPVTFYTEDIQAAHQWASLHGIDFLRSPGLKLTQMLPERQSFELAVVVTINRTDVKQEAIRLIETRFPGHPLIAINTEGISLSLLQEGSLRPEYIVGLNWTEPAYTTLFLELIVNLHTNQDRAGALLRRASQSWKKDPYLVRGELGIRSRLIGALIREAFYLVENGYATIEDIDRACRNDAGYYLPFAGNFRYMDLMGTYAYGVVMKELNKELCKSREIPGFFINKLEAGHLGMRHGQGFYAYSKEEAAEWERRMSRFSNTIRGLMDRYPFKYEEPCAED